MGVYDLAETLSYGPADAASVYMEWVDRFLCDSRDSSPGALFGAMHRFTAVRPAHNQWTRDLIVNSYEMMR